MCRRLCSGRICMLGRREFILLVTGAAIAGSRRAQAQAARKVYRIGVIETASSALNGADLHAFRQGMQDLGYFEGRDFVIEFRAADGRAERYPDLANELVRLNVDLIMTRGTPAALAAKNATKSIPIVLSGLGDPVAAGVVDSLAH